MSESRSIPLAGLRVVEACARLRNFSRAAEELGITPGAVTQHIHAVEQWAETTLFVRSGRDLLLGEALGLASTDLHEAFGRLASAVRILKAANQRGNFVSLSAPPSFTSKWLLPRLDRFRSIHPGVEVWISADASLVDFTRSNVDLAIRYGTGNYDGLTAQKLFVDNVLPVASPDFIARHGPLETPQALLGARLLHDQEETPGAPTADWMMWFRSRGVAVDGVIDGPRYNMSSLVIEEAVAGKGVALARGSIAQADLASGRLVPLFSDSSQEASAYWLVWPSARTLMPPVRAFISWLAAQPLADDGLPVEMSGS